MKVNRKDLLKVLKTSQIGLTKHEVLEQSNCFVFTEGHLITFNDEILTRVKSPLDFDATVPVQDFLKVLTKLPDEAVDISQKGTELIIKGSRREAGITCFSEILLPYDAVPLPAKWRKIGKGVPVMLQQAARTCGKDASSPLTTMVHVTPDHVEACDNYRMFRCDIKTGLRRSVLIPASSVLVLGGLVLKRISVAKGWAHFQTDSGHEISCRCSNSKYADVSKILVLKSSETVVLPSNLGDMVSRAEVMATDAGHDSALVRIEIQDGKLTITSRKDAGWFKEHKRTKYAGPPLAFEVSPKFLADVLKRTRKVKIGHGISKEQKKMKLEVENVKFVVCLEV